MDIRKLPYTLNKYYAFNHERYEDEITGKLYLASPLDFNDPLDCQFSLSNNSRDVDKKTVEDRLTELFGENGNIQEKLSHLIDDKHECYEETLKEVQKKQLEKLGVLCMSPDDDNILMWAYYGNNQGFCIEFDTNKLINDLNCKLVDQLEEDITKYLVGIFKNTGNETIKGETIKGEAIIKGEATIKGDAIFKGETIKGEAIIKGEATIKGDAIFKGEITFIDKSTATNKKRDIDIRPNPSFFRTVYKGTNKVLLEELNHEEERTDFLHQFYIRRFNCDKIQYCDELDRNDPPLFFTKGNREKQRAKYNTKLSIWKHENEYRLSFSLGGRKIIEVEEKCISSITFGYNIKAENLLVLHVALLKKGLGNILLYKIERNHTRFIPTSLRHTDLLNNQYKTLVDDLLNFNDASEKSPAVENFENLIKKVTNQKTNSLYTLNSWREAHLQQIKEVSKYIEKSR